MNSPPELRVPYGCSETGLLVPVAVAARGARYTCPGCAVILVLRDVTLYPRPEEDPRRDTHLGASNVPRVGVDGQEPAVAAEVMHCTPIDVLRVDHPTVDGPGLVLSDHQNAVFR